MHPSAAVPALIYHSRRLRQAGLFIPLATDDETETCYYEQATCGLRRPENEGFVTILLSRQIRARRVAISNLKQVYLNGVVALEKGKEKDFDSRTWWWDKIWGLGYQECLGLSSGREDFTVAAAGTLAEG